jgi:hypothetical protein
MSERGTGTEDDESGDEIVGTFHMSNEGIVVTGGEQVINNYYGTPAPPPKATLAERRQDFFFEFLNRSLKQSELTFRLSIVFLAGGGAVILAGAVLAVARAGNPDFSYLPLVTSLTGALVTVGGGALALHARRARSHVTEQASRVELKIDDDDRLGKAKALIERVEDATLKDRLKATAALHELGFAPDANETANRLMPQRDKPAGEIEPGTENGEIR